MGPVDPSSLSAPPTAEAASPVNSASLSDAPFPAAVPATGAAAGTPINGAALTDPPGGAGPAAGDSPSAPVALNPSAPSDPPSAPAGTPTAPSGGAPSNDADLAGPPSGVASPPPFQPVNSASLSDAPAAEGSSDDAAGPTRDQESEPAGVSDAPEEATPPRPRGQAQPRQKRAPRSR
jgi:hypothetical protein